MTPVSRFWHTQLNFGINQLDVGKQSQVQELTWILREIHKLFKGHLHPTQTYFHFWGLRQWTGGNKCMQFYWQKAWENVELGKGGLKEEVLSEYWPTIGTEKDREAWVHISIKLSHETNRVTLSWGLLFSLIYLTGLSVIRIKMVCGPCAPTWAPWRSDITKIKGLVWYNKNGLI